MSWAEKDFDEDRKTHARIAVALERIATALENQSQPQWPAKKAPWMGTIDQKAYEAIIRAGQVIEQHFTKTAAG